jgi:hypothetical protein
VEPPRAPRGRPPDRRSQALSKRDVEALLAAVAAAPDDPAGELAALVDALRAPLARATGAPASTPWRDLVDHAAAVAGWDPARAAALRAEPPTGATRPALWDLVAELNELRGLDRAHG